MEAAGLRGTSCTSAGRLSRRVSGGTSTYLGAFFPESPLGFPFDVPESHDLQEQSLHASLDTIACSGHTTRGVCLHLSLDGARSTAAWPTTDMSGISHGRAVHHITSCGMIHLADPRYQVFSSDRTREFDRRPLSALPLPPSMYACLEKRQFTFSMLVKAGAWHKQTPGHDVRCR